MVAQIVSKFHCLFGGGRQKMWFESKSHSYSQRDASCMERRKNGVLDFHCLFGGGRQKMCLESKGPYSQGDASTGHAEISFRMGRCKNGGSDWSPQPLNKATAHCLFE